MTMTRTKYPTWTRSILIDDLLGLQVLQEKSLREDSEARYKAENGCSASQCGPPHEQISTMDKISIEIIQYQLLINSG